MSSLFLITHLHFYPLIPINTFQLPLRAGHVGSWDQARVSDVGTEHLLNVKCYSLPWHVDLSSLWSTTPVCGLVRGKKRVFSSHHKVLLITWVRPNGLRHWLSAWRTQILAIYLVFVFYTLHHVELRDKNWTTWRKKGCSSFIIDLMNKLLISREF